jgi:hypothetical protein
MKTLHENIDKELSPKLSNTDRAYLAGLFDGEGCVNATFGTKRWTTKKEKERIYLFPRIQFVISSKNNLLLELVRAMIGFGRVYGEKMYDYRVTGRKQVLEIVDALLPFVKLKKTGLQLSKEAILFLLQREHLSKWTKEELVSFREQFVLPLQKLLPSGERRGRPPKYKFNEIISKYY